MNNSELRSGPGHALRDIQLDRASQASLVSQLVRAIETLIDGGTLRAGEKIPSVRCIARELQVSTFTVVEANERLLAAGRLHSRRGSGYFVARHLAASPAESRGRADAFIPGDSSSRAAGSMGYVASSSDLPFDWYGDDYIQEATRRAMRVHPGRLVARGDELGFPDLRRLLSQRLRSGGMDIDEYRVLLTGGAAQACDLILRALCQPGDRILVEDPCSASLRSLVALHGCIALPVPRDQEGLDLDEFARLAEGEKPKLAFIQTVAQNPLGTTLSASQVHRLLALAERFDLMLVENDMYREISVPGAPSLAAMDGFRRVIRVDSTVTTLSPLLRVGSICASPSLVSRVAQIKLATGGSGSRLEERVAFQIIGSSDYRRMVARLRNRLDGAMASGIEKVRSLGLEPIHQQANGLFLCARSAAGSDDQTSESGVVRLAAERGVPLVPGHRFTASPGVASWFRINVAHIDHRAGQSPFLLRTPASPDAIRPACDHHLT